MAAALGIGIDVTAPEGNMVVDIGGGTTEIAVIALGGIVCNQSIRVAGDVFTQEIQQYMRHQHNIKIGERTAEDIKISVGSALSDLTEQPEPMLVRGPNLMTALPVEVSVTSQEIAHCLDKSLAKIESARIGCSGTNATGTVFRYCSTWHLSYGWRRPLTRYQINVCKTK